VKVIKQLLIIFHSITGGSEQIARAVAQGARKEPEIEVILLQAQQVQPEHLLAASGYIFIAPEMLGSLSGIMKDFFDRTFYQVLDELNWRPYAALICAGSDGQGARRQLEKIATGWRLKKVAETQVILTHAQTKQQILQTKTVDQQSLLASKELGTFFSSALALAVF
jgi:multimeric flavodoxin WrbA